MEFPIEFFLDLARDPRAGPRRESRNSGGSGGTRIGPAHAAEIADIVSKYTKYNGRRKPELLEPGTFSLTTIARRTRGGRFQLHRRDAERISRSLPENARDAFFQLVLYPTQASAVVTELYVTAGKNRVASQGRASANDLAARAHSLFQEDAALSDFYNREMAHGKWDHMMDQTHIGYTFWNQPPENTMPKVASIPVPPAADMGVAVEGSARRGPGASGEPALPSSMPSISPPASSTCSIGGKPRSSFGRASAPWIVLSAARGTVEKEQRLW